MPSASPPPGSLIAPTIHRSITLSCSHWHTQQPKAPAFRLPLCPALQRRPSLTSANIQHQQPYTQRHTCKSISTAAGMQAATQIANQAAWCTPWTPLPQCRRLRRTAASSTRGGPPAAHSGTAAHSWSAHRLLPATPGPLQAAATFGCRGQQCPAVGSTAAASHLRSRAPQRARCW